MIELLKKFLAEQLEDSKEGVKRAIKNKSGYKQSYFEGKASAYRRILDFIKEMEVNDDSNNM